MNEIIGRLFPESESNIHGIILPPFFFFYFQDVKSISAENKRRVKRSKRSRRSYGIISFTVGGEEKKERKKNVKVKGRLELVFPLA